uniref:hypothetical protein n=1 Tax=Armatimonas sp. TaxID=1872638 RepID=UPI00286CFD00
SPHYHRARIRAKSLIKGLQGELDEAYRLVELLKTPHQSHHEIAYNLVLCAHLEYLAGNFFLSTQLYGTSVAWCQRKGFDLHGYNYSSREKNLALLCERFGDKAFQALYDEGYNRHASEILQSLAGSKQASI